MPGKGAGRAAAEAARSAVPESAKGKAVVGAVGAGGAVTVGNAVNQTGGSVSTSPPAASSTPSLGPFAPVIEFVAAYPWILVIVVALVGLFVLSTND